MIKKIKRKKRIHIGDNVNNVNNVNIIGCIILSQKTINKNKNKTFSLNLTKFYLENSNSYQYKLYQDKSMDSIIKELKIKKELREKILIYKEGNIELYIIVVNFHTKIKNFQEKTFFDLYKSETFNKSNHLNKSNNIYNSVYFSTIKTTNIIFRNINININPIKIEIKLIDIYYYLIGHI